MNISHFFLTSLLLIGFAIPSAFAESVTISSDTEVLTEPFEKFILRGVIENPGDIKSIQILIYDPDGNVVYSPMIPVNSDGSFMNIAKVESSWTKDGVYTIEATSEKLSEVASTEIELRVGANLMPSSPMISIEGFDVGHGGDVGIQSASANPTQNTLTFNLEEINDSEITLSLPFSLIENPNAVWVDGVQISEFGVTQKGQFSGLVIPIQSDSQEIVVMGTSVVPEFGTIAALILAISLISIILISKNGRFAMPKF